MGYFKNKSGEIVAKFNLMSGTYFDESLYDVVYVDKHEKLEKVIVIKHKSVADEKISMNKLKLEQLLSKEIL